MALISPSISTNLLFIRPAWNRWLIFTLVAFHPPFASLIFADSTTYYEHDYQPNKWGMLRLASTGVPPQTKVNAAGRPALLPGAAFSLPRGTPHWRTSSAGSCEPVGLQWIWFMTARRHWQLCSRSAATIC